MFKFKCFLLLLTVLFSGLHANPFEQNDQTRIIANLTAAMLNKMHYVKHDISPQTSEKLFDSYVKTLDPMRIFFTKEEIQLWKLQQHRILPNLISSGDVSFAFGLFKQYLYNLKEYEKFALSLKFQPSDFEKDEVYEIDRSKSEWPANRKEQHELWRKKLKSDVLSIMLQDRVKKEEADKKGKKAVKNSWDKKTPLEKVQKRISQFVHNNQKMEPIDVLELYLNSLAKLYDPHTTYMAPRSEEDFNIQMKLSLVGIGAVLTSEDGYTKIIQIIPGGPADLDKRLKADDRIIAVAQGNDPPVDVIDMPLSKVVSMIRGKEDTKVTLTILEAIKGANAIPVNITLTRKKVALKDSEAKGELRTVTTPNGEKLNIGIISLPSFYIDFKAASDGDKNYKSSTRDVRNIILDFKKKGKLDGVIMDLRSNGGGSLQEAVSLTGLFIRTGPVVQVRDSQGSLDVYRDNDPEILYDGPLVVMTNRLSASASEIFSGAIKDYKRGIIVGDTRTHGKGSVQTIADLGEYLKYAGYQFPAGAIKMTNAKFYRVNGSSTQLKGVTTHISFPTFSDILDTGEDKLDNPIAWDSIDPVQHSEYGNRTQSILDKLRFLSEKRIASDPGFRMLKYNIEYLRKEKENKTISLNFRTRWEKYLKEKDIYDEQAKLLHLDDESKEKKKNNKKDLYLDETINIMLDYIRIRKTPSGDLAENSNGEK